VIEVPLSELLRLSQFSGEPRDAMRAMVRWVHAEIGACSIGFIQLQGDIARLAALTDAAGMEVILASTPFDDGGNLMKLDDPETRTLLQPIACRLVHVEPALSATTLLTLLGTPEVLLLVPLVNDGKVLHALLLGAPQVMLARVNLATALVQFNLIYQLLGRGLNARSLQAQPLPMRRQLSDLADIQRALLPDNPSIKGMLFAAHYQPAEIAAGDYYDVVKLSHRISGTYPDNQPDTFGFILADVSGHGAGAAMEVVQFDAILRTYRGTDGDGPAAALTYANRYFFSRRQRQHFITVFALVVLPLSGVVRYCCAGHPPALRLSNGMVERIGQNGDIPLGILRDHVFSNQVLPNQPGDCFVLYSDGITEARNPQGEMFGIERLEALVAAGDGKPEQIMTRIRDAVHQHQQGPIGVDDQTLLVIQLVA
jgi:phosphoserine phosphatase RsbU/P